MGTGGAAGTGGAMGTGGAAGTGGAMGTGGAAPGCGNSTVDAGEECDGAAPEGKTCTDYGYVAAGTLACGPDCKVSLAGCKAACNNGVTEPGEECDTTAGPKQFCTGACTIQDINVVINEIRYNDGTNPDTETFIELFGTPNLSLNGFKIVGIDGANGNTTGEIDLKGKKLNADGYFVAYHSQITTVPALADESRMASDVTDFQDGPDAVRLVFSGMTVDAVGYGNPGANPFYGEGPLSTDYASNSANTLTESLCRMPNGTDTNNNRLDFQVCAPSPGTANP